MSAMDVQVAAEPAFLAQVHQALQDDLRPGRLRSHLHRSRRPQPLRSALDFIPITSGWQFETRLAFTHKSPAPEGGRGRMMGLALAIDEAHPTGR